MSGTLDFLEVATRQTVADIMKRHRAELAPHIKVLCDIEAIRTPTHGVVSPEESIRRQLAGMQERHRAEAEPLLQQLSELEMSRPAPQIMTNEEAAKFHRDACFDWTPQWR